MTTLGTNDITRESFVMWVVKKKVSCYVKNIVN